MAPPLREGGGKGLATQKKEFVEIKSSHKSYLFFSEKTYSPVCASCSDLPSNISTVPLAKKIFCPFMANQLFFVKK